MRIAFDTGGTFTDCVFQRGGRLEILKIPSTPLHPEEAISHALSRISRLEGADRHLDLVCGTTVGTNALLERRGGRVALVTTAGFEDVLEIGRQARTRLYDLMVKKSPPLVPKERRYGLRERLDSEGHALLSPSDAEIARIVSAVVRSGARSVAVCLLFSFVNPAHENVISRALLSAGLQVSASHRILPEYREFERTSTTVVNAYLVPVMSDYLAGIDHIAKASTAIEAIVPETKIFVGPASRRRFFGVAPDTKPPGRRRHNESVRSRHHARHWRVRVMQSNGGILSAGAAALEPVRTILSGPAGGVLGAQYIAATAGLNRIITFDMGGTSTDVSLMQSGSADALATTRETIVSEVPVAVSMLDIHTVGAGGGSIARFDHAGALRVGPESAGADPGPICYGRGNRPTVTDANLVLGRIPESGLLGGEFKLDIRRTRHYMDRALASLPSPLRRGIRSIDAFAQGILDVANAVMEKAIRVISVERGHDPRDYTLVAFGGAGALHACDLAADLEISRVLVPCLPGALSALGILRADVTKDLSRTIRLESRSLPEMRLKLDQEFARLEREGLKQMRGEGFADRAVRVDRSLDMRYSGQSYELAVPFRGDYIAAFHCAHEQRYGYSDRTRPCDVVNVRARFTGRTPKPSLPRVIAGGTSPRSALVSIHRAFFANRRHPIAVYDRAKLRAGNRLSGPAIVTEYSATTLIPPSWVGRVDRFGNILLERRRDTPQELRG